MGAILLPRRTHVLERSSCPPELWLWNRKQASKEAPDPFVLLPCSKQRILPDSPRGQPPGSERGSERQSTNIRREPKKVTIKEFFQFLKTCRKQIPGGSLVRLGKEHGFCVRKNLIEVPALSLYHYTSLRTIFNLWRLREKNEVMCIYFWQLLWQ